MVIANHCIAKQTLPMHLRKPCSMITHHTTGHTIVIIPSSLNLCHTSMQAQEFGPDEEVELHIVTRPFDKKVRLQQLYFTTINCLRYCALLV